MLATPDEKIKEVIKNANGNVIKTQGDHQTGTDRIYEIFDKTLNKKPKFIINLQGDMPNINSNDIKNLAIYIKKKFCDIATLGSELLEKKEMNNKNVVKVSTVENIKNKGFSQVKDFFRLNSETEKNFVYHHIGIYAFTSDSLINYVSLKRSNLELKRNLEQIKSFRKRYEN